jgi:hypothetical protein
MASHRRAGEDAYMEIVGIVMLGSVALWIMHEIDSRT